MTFYLRRIIEFATKVAIGPKELTGRALIVNFVGCNILHLANNSDYGENPFNNVYM